MKPAEPVPRMRAGHRAFFHQQGEPLFGPGAFDLLVLVDEAGSLHQAAKRVPLPEVLRGRFVRAARRLAAES